MKRNAAVLIAVMFILSLAAIAYAAETQKGTIKSVDSKAGTITFCPEGTTKDTTLKADMGIDLTTVRPEMKAEIIVDLGTVQAVRELKKTKRAPVGC